MPVLACKIFIFASLGLLGGCAVVAKARLIAAEGAGRAVVAECSLSERERTRNLQAVNGWLMAGSYPYRALALDCDGDGTSDF